VAGGFVWGRGALDVKLLVALHLESVGSLLAAGYRPRRTLLFTWGQDEELGGSKGAGVCCPEARLQTNALLHSQGTGVCVGRRCAWLTACRLPCHARARAAAVANLLKQRGVTLEMIVDEGSAVAMDGLPPFYRQPVALVATAEKAAVGIQVRASCVRPGHWWVLASVCPAHSQP
jgi:carboxypeptidase PM20D1